MKIKDSKVIFCSYFDKGFLQKGLALHASLTKYNPKAELWILAFDDYTKEILKKLKLKGVTVISLSEFEDKELLAVKPTRNVVEYYWTCTPSLPLYVLNNSKDTDYVVYLDADLYFYSSVAPMIEEIGNGQILAVEHRFPKSREHIAKDSGRFNVAVNIFKNDKEGIKCLKRWRNQCLDWCYWRHEDGKLGDQMYLDEWPDRYKSLVISENIGVDAAPWNISQYEVSKKYGKVYLNKQKLICYHFHQFQILGPKNFSRVLGYTLSKNTVEYIYKPYERELIKQYKKIKKIDPRFEVKRLTHNNYQIFRQRMAKIFGPVYWRLQGIISK